MNLDELAGLAGQTVVLTNTEQEARALRRKLFALVEQQLDVSEPALEQNTAWFENTLVLPVDQWLVALWDQHFAVRQVLRPVQLQALARKVLEQSALLPDTVVSSAAIARQFVQAFEIAARYRMAEPPAQYPMLAGEHFAFLQWRDSLQDLLDQQQLLTGGQLADALSAALAEPRDLRLPDTLVLLAELEIEPATSGFIQNCSLKVEKLALPAPSAGAQFAFVADTLVEEVNACARWCAGQLTIGEGIRVGIVVANARRYNAPLKRALCRYVHPQQLFPAFAGADESLEMPWEQPGAGRLLDHAVAVTARDIFSLAESEFEFVALSRVLLSPYVTAACPQFDLLCRDSLGHKTNLFQVLREFKYGVEKKGIGENVDHIAALHNVVQTLPKKALPSTWTRHFDTMLQVCGWPNTDSDLAEQCRRGLSQVMDSLRTMDRQTGELSLSDAMSWLFQLLDEKRFEVKRQHSAPISILEFDDAVGVEFDAVWLLGLDGSALPKAPQTSPFLPTAWMFGAGVPRVRAEDCLTRDKAAVDALLARVPEVIVSYAKQDDEGVLQLPSALLAWRFPLLADENKAAFSVFGELEIPSTDAVPPLQPTERSTLSGGTGLFKAIAHSPFAAFCQHRLKLSQFPKVSEGLDARQQGNWVHKILEHLWGELENSDKLLALTEHEQSELVSRWVDQTVMSFEPYVGAQLLAIERRRLHAVVTDWLNHERERLQPFAVEACEKVEHIEIAGLPLTIMSDRIDSVAGHRLIIDYKTGNVKPKNLNVDDFLEPQLPIYALYTPQQVDGVALAQVQAGEPDHFIRSAWCASLDKKKRQHGVDNPEAWAHELEAWQKVIEALAEQFKSGDIRHNTDNGWGYGDWLLPLLPNEFGEVALEGNTG